MISIRSSFFGFYYDEGAFTVPLFDNVRLVHARNRAEKRLTKAESFKHCDLEVVKKDVYRIEDRIPAEQNLLLPFLVRSSNGAVCPETRVETSRQASERDGPREMPNRGHPENRPW